MLPASLPGRLTESLVWSKDRIWPWLGAGLIDGKARIAVPLDGGGVHLHSLYRHIADLLLGLERLVIHHVDGAGHQYWQLKRNVYSFEGRQNRRKMEKYAKMFRRPETTKNVKKKFGQ